LASVATILKSRLFLESIVPAPHETSQSGNDGEKFSALNPVRRHPQVRGDLLDVQVLAVLMPVSIEMADISIPRSKSTSFAL